MISTHFLDFFKWIKYELKIDFVLRTINLNSLCSIYRFILNKETIKERDNVSFNTFFSSMYCKNTHFTHSYPSFQDENKTTFGQKYYFFVLLTLFSFIFLVNLFMNNSFPWELLLIKGVILLNYLIEASIIWRKCLFHT